MYDIVVIGAGVTGCTAAKILAENGFSVLLAERCKLPRYKSCSGILIKKSIDLVKKYFNAEIPQSVMCTPFDNRGMIICNDKNQMIRYEQKGINVWRSSFDYWLLAHSVANGAKVYDETSVTKCVQSKNSVEITLSGKHSSTVKTKYAIDCGGATDHIKRQLIGGKKDCIITYQTFNNGTIDLDNHYFYAYLQRELSEYDAWFNVKDDMLVLGVAVKNNKNIQMYYNNFIEYMRRNNGLKIDTQRKAEKWILPHIRPNCKIDYGCGNVLFAGENAGFLNPMGEGISAGLESGFCVARAITDNFENADWILNAYKDMTKELKEYMVRQWNLTSMLSDTFSDMQINRRVI